MPTITNPIANVTQIANRSHASLQNLIVDDHTLYVLRSILTADGDIFIRSGGVIARLAKGSDGNLLSLVSGLPAWVAGGMFSSQNVVTGSRVIGTTYQNTQGKTMLAVVTIQSASSATLSGITDSNASPTTVVCTMAFGTNAFTANMVFMVLNNNYYKVTTSSGSPTLQYWVEWY